ncbi:MBL fold metallo-hydrolase [Nocardioides fonticola]
MTTRVHHLNCGTMRPIGGGRGGLLPASMVAHCLLVERDRGLLLVDTGFGTADIADPGRLGQPFRAMVGPRLDAGETAIAQVRARGFDPRDVTDIVVTHLDLDHAGGLGDFPHARVHVYDRELSAALRPGLRERARYVQAQWAHGPQWVTHEARGDSWRGLRAVRALGDDVVLVPLHGHTRGHAGVAVDTGGEDGWLLHAGDAYFHASEATPSPHAPVGLVAFQRLMSIDDRTRRANQERIRQLAASQVDVRVFCAHDVQEFEELAGR